MDLNNIQGAYYVTIALGSCGGESCPNSVEVLAIDALCNESDDTALYMLLQKGDIVTKEEEGSIVHILHTHDDEKFICIESGKASILRLD
ncbi:MAG: hypothetical protein KU28_06765 [Sulfurovum sp. PC08-66]|nr:MAG: hypothetical protein KU28_06765 [Sulfurovum sp. PC08-66]